MLFSPSALTGDLAKTWGPCLWSPNGSRRDGLDDFLEKACLLHSRPHDFPLAAISHSTAETAKPVVTAALLFRAPISGLTHRAYIECGSVWLSA